MRPSGRAPDQIRELSFEAGFTHHAEGSCLVSFGGTRVLCTASVEDKVPPFLRGKGQGWVTAEYGMLPRATHTRGNREAAKGKQSGRTQEIQRLIGRSLRAVVDLAKLPDRQIVRDQPIEDALAAASAALSGLSQAAGVVMAPKRDLRLKQLAFVPLAPDRALAVLVGSDSSVENRIVSLDPGTTPAALEQVANFINARLSGLTLSDAEARLRTEIRQRREALDVAAAELIAAGLAAWSEDHARRPVLIVRGQANLIDPAAAEDLERVKQLLDELENREEIVRLLEAARDASGCRIFIGSENRMFALSGSSVIAAPYCGSEGQVVGVVGVIGPTRLNYARVVPMVDFTAKALTRLMA